jgi:hypothetical protein
MTESLFLCRVCGLDCSPFLPWGADGTTPSYSICSRCGVEFGYEDTSDAGVLIFREKYLSKNSFIAEIKSACRCCGVAVFDAPCCGDYSICPVCGWEDDPVQFDDPTYPGGANRLSLNMAREEFSRAKSKADSN